MKKAFGIGSLAFKNCSFSTNYVAKIDANDLLLRASS